MRISLTALTDQGPRDVVVIGDSDMTVGTVARSLIATLNADAVREVIPGLPILLITGMQILQHVRVFHLIRHGHGIHEPWDYLGVDGDFAVRRIRTDNNSLHRVLLHWPRLHDRRWPGVAMTTGYRQCKQPPTQ